MELNKKQNSKLLFAKKDYLSKVLDYFMTEQEKENTTIFKLINELHAKKIITADMQKLLQYAVINYQFKIVDILAECEELHIRLYDKEQLKLEYKQQQEQEQKQLTLKQWYDKFIELYKKNYVTDTTLKATNYDFEKFKPIHNKLLSDIKGMDIQKCINEIPYPSTQIRLHILINSILEKAVLNDLIIKNVAKQLVKPKYQAKQKRALTKAEETIFINACKKHKFGNFYLICLYQGLRKGECRALKVNDVDFENNTLRIDESLNTHTSRTTTKNKQSNRIMPLFDKTKELLKELVKGKGKDDLIINIGVNRVDKAMRDILKETGLKLSTHILRHTFITRCQELNIPIFVIQSWVGHEKGSVVTTKIYTHLNKDTNKQYIDIFNKN